MALAASAPLFNDAVAAYNSNNFHRAVHPLRAAAHACTLLADVGALSPSDVRESQHAPV